MDNNRINYLHDRFLTGKLTVAERTEWQRIADDPEMEEQMLSMIENSWRQTPDTALKDMPQDRSKEILNQIVTQPQRLIKPAKLWPRIVAVAAAVTLTVIGIYFYNNWISYNHSQFAMQNIAPGKVGATLTLANGKKIRLSDAGSGEIAREAGISVTKTAEGQLVYEIKSNEDDPNNINTLSTAKGETYILTLPDKSKVWLNAASSLTYTAGLMNHGLRKIKLSGEAYFEISKDKLHPFVVESNDQQVEVLGTHFNVNAYSDEPAISTTLLEGSVKVTSGKNQQLLTPGFQVINNGHALKVMEADIETTIDWKKGDFNLDGLDFKSAMRKIGRWYDLEVIYDKSVSDNIMSGGWISRNTKLSTILEVVERSGQVHFELEGRKLYVSR